MPRSLYDVFDPLEFFGHIGSSQQSHPIRTQVTFPFGDKDLLVRTFIPSIYARNASGLYALQRCRDAIVNTGGVAVVCCISQTVAREDEADRTRRRWARIAGS